MLKEIIDEFFLNREKERGERERVRFYISESGKCPRAIFFNFKRARKKEDAEKLRIFELGNRIHQMISEALVDKGIVSTTEVSIPSHEMISGRADMIINIEGMPYVVEIKSISSRMNPARMQEPIANHQEQLQLYLHYFRVPRGIILYVNKDTQEIKEFICNYNGNLVRNILNRFEGLRSKIKSNIIPARLADYPKNWQCKKCSYREICRMANAEEMKWGSLKSKIETS